MIEDKKIFQTYWSQTYETQRQFIRENTKLLIKKRHTKKEPMLSRRKNTIEYFLPSDSAKIQVCKKTFLKTLDIGERTIAYTLKKRRPHSNSDNRGKQCPTTNILESEKEIIRQHIRSFPVIESHYCRKTSQRKYLEKDPSIRNMYDLYCNELKNKGASVRNFCFTMQFLALNSILDFTPQRKMFANFVTVIRNYNRMKKKSRKKNIKNIRVERFKLRRKK